MEKNYSNKIRKPKSYTVGEYKVGAKAGPSQWTIGGKITIPLSEDFSIMFGGKETSTKKERDNLYSVTNEHIKVRLREMGFNFKNFSAKYKQSSQKTKWEQQHKFGPETRGGSFKSDMGRSLELNLYNLKLNKSGTLTANINVGIHRPYNEEHINAGFKYNW